MNRTIRLLMISDVLVSTGFGLIEPILAIFIKDGLQGGTIFSAGFASTIFLITKSVVQLPFSRYVDSHDHKVRFLIIGTFLIALVPFFYIFATHIYGIYIAQLLFGIGSGLAFPTWLGLWTAHLDRHHESYEWSLYSTSVGIGVAVSAAVGATLAEFLGFQVTFLLVGLFSLIGCAILFRLEESHHASRPASSHDFHRKEKNV